MPYRLYKGVPPGFYDACIVYEALSSLASLHYLVHTVFIPLLQDPLILEAKGIKIGFLGYCDIPSVNKNCTQMRMLFNSGPAIYREDIATREVNKLKKVFIISITK